MPISLIAAGVSAVGSIAGGVLGSNAASSAASAEATAAHQASKTQLEMFNDIQKNLAPFLQGGTNALGNLTGVLGSSTPQYGQHAQPINQLQALVGTGAPSAASLLNGGSNLNNVLSNY